MRAVFQNPWILMLLMFAGICRITKNLPFALVASILLYGFAVLVDHLRGTER